MIDNNWDVNSVNMGIMRGLGYMYVTLIRDTGI